MVKKINYLWLGGKPLPKPVALCIESWKRYCLGWEIVRWDESNLPIDKYRWVKEAISAKRWAFATDFLRMWVLYNYGGVYMDTDVEIVAPIDPYITNAFVTGIENHYFERLEKEFDENGYNMLNGGGE